MRVLIVEDEAKMAGLLRRGLEREGMAVDIAGEGEEALWKAEAVEYDAIVLDLMLPGIDGLEVCGRLRESGIWSPILMLTARDAVRDRVAGLDRGADDYLTKPFSYVELLARLRALVRRGRPERPIEIRVGDLRLDPATRQAWRGRSEVVLSAKEFSLLETFMRRPGEVLSRFQLIEHAWDYEYENRSNVVDSYVRFLRATIDRPFGVESIETVRGFRDKQLMKDRVAAAGLRVPRAQRVRSIAEAWGAVEHTGFPAIIKPISGAGSADTYKVESRADLERVLPHLHHVPEAICEEFIAGEEYTYDTVSIAGRPAYESVTRYLPNALMKQISLWQRISV